jgi:hypothetical protein
VRDLVAAGEDLADQRFVGQQLGDLVRAE